MIRKRCIHCKAKLPEGERIKIHQECIAPYADAMQAKTKRAKARKAALEAKADRADANRRKEAMKKISELEADCRKIVQEIARIRDRDDGCISCHMGKNYDGA